MLHVHQFFTKLIGCAAVEHHIPLPVASFAQHLKTGTAVPTLRIAFAHIPPGSTKDKIKFGDMDVTTDKVTDLIETARWRYDVGSLGVVVSYERTGIRELRLMPKRGWNPHDISQTWKLEPIRDIDKWTRRFRD